MINKAVKPAEYMPSIYANHPEKHAYELDETVSVKISEIFKTVTPAIYNAGDDLKVIEERTRKSLENVDMSMIKPYDTINLCCSEHGFGLMGGWPYLTMVKTIKKVVEERTNNQRIRVVLAMYRTPAETTEVIEHFNLHDELDCEIVGTGPFSPGVEIPTSIGPVLGIKQVYDCDWMIYAYYDDPREMYVHRGVHRVLKSFMMNFARYETRCSVHRTFGQTSVMMIPSAVYESEFVQSRWAFSTIMMTSPTGVCDVRSDHDLYKISKISMANTVKNYSIIRQLFARLNDWYAIWDGGRWGYYLHTAGMVFGACMQATNDFFDLDVPYSNGRGSGVTNYQGGRMNVFMGIMKTFKGCVMNQSWTGIIFAWIPMLVPFFCVGQEQLEMYRNDKTNQGMGPGTAVVDTCKVVDTLEEGIDKAEEVMGTRNYIVFDGSFDNINCSRSAAEDIVSKAAEAEAAALADLPRYLRQRGFTPEEIDEYMNR